MHFTRDLLLYLALLAAAGIWITGGLLIADISFPSPTQIAEVQ
jgi:hypothetical protein